MVAAGNLQRGFPTNPMIAGRPVTNFGPAPDSPTTPKHFAGAMSKLTIVDRGPDVRGGSAPDTEVSTLSSASGVAHCSANKEGLGPPGSSVASDEPESAQPVGPGIDLKGIAAGQHGHREDRKSTNFRPRTTGSSADPDQGSAERGSGRGQGARTPRRKNDKRRSVNYRRSRGLIVAMTAPANHGWAANADDDRRGVHADDPRAGGIPVRSGPVAEPTARKSARERCTNRKAARIRRDPSTLEA